MSNSYYTNIGYDSNSINSNNSDHNGFPPSHLSEFSTRKRNQAFFYDETGQDMKIKVPLPDLDFNDPNFLKLLKEYENDEDDILMTPIEREKELQTLRAKAKDRPLFDQTLTYVIMLVAFGLFVLLINWCNSKELQRLKEEYGLEAQKELPELWWKKAVVYRLHIPTFSDSTGDGIGDLRGVLDNLDYFMYLGVDGIILTSLVEYSTEDNYVGVSDFTNVDPKLGNFPLLNLLMKKFHEKGLKLIIELVPNHTSKKHPWFQKSVKENHDAKFGGDEIDDPSNYMNYYIWHDGKLDESTSSRIPPNNWLGKDSSPAWTFNDTSGAYYYHHVHRNLPDLNHRNIDVQREMMSIFKFWLDQGFDAIYLNDVSPMFESVYTDVDEPFNLKALKIMEDKGFTHEKIMKTMPSYDFLNHISTINQPELHDYLGSWNEFVQSYSLKRGQRLALLINIPTDESNSETVGIAKNYLSWADTPISHSLMNINLNCGGICLHELIDASLGKLSQGVESMWMIGHEKKDQHMLAIYHNVYNALIMLLPGGVLLKNSAEMGIFKEFRQQEDYLAPGHKEMFDQLVRNLTSSSSFTPTFVSASLPESTASLSSASLKNFHYLTRLKKEESFTNGRIQYAIVNKDIFSFVRFASNSVPYLVALNFGSSISIDDYTFSSGVARGKVALKIPSHEKFAPGHKEENIDVKNVVEEATNSIEEGFVEGDVITLSRVVLRPGEGVVVVLVTDNPTNDNDDGNDDSDYIVSPAA